jgi:endo-1,4-beta-xylanase
MCAQLLVCALSVCALAMEPQPILLWPNGAPGSEGKTGEETVRLTELGERIVSHVNHPSITPYLPDKDKSTGAAMIVIPGGGHRELWMDHEGYRVGQWLSDHGVAAFVLKYRLALESGSTYTVERDSLTDVQRAIRLVRSRSHAWNIAVDRVGVIGFSAGGELAALAGTHADVGKRSTKDPVERESSQPAFMALIYPSIPATMNLSKETPPAFLLCGENDSPQISQRLPDLYFALKLAGASAELHILTAAGHGFGIRASNPPALSRWTSLLDEWLDARGFLASR